MIINKVELTNFKSHENTKIDFNTGITVILGNNGAGKSSILEAISYALFKKVDGKLGELNRKTGDNENITNMKVKVDFTHNSRSYSVTRGKKTSATAQLRYNEENNKNLICKGDSNVTSEIMSILNLDSDSFLNAVYIKQGEITELIDKTPAERQKFISKLLNIDSLKNAWEHMRDVIEEYENLKNVNEGRLSREENKRQELEQLEQEIKTSISSIDQLKTQQKKYDEEFTKIKQVKEENEKNKKEYDNITMMISEKEGRINDLKESMGKYEKEKTEIEKTEVEIKELEKEVKVLPEYRRFKDTKTELDKINEKLEHNSTEINRIQKQHEIMDEIRADYDAYLIHKIKNEEILKRKEELLIKHQEYQQIITRRKDAENRKNKLVKQINQTVEKAHKLLNKTFTSPEDVEKTIDEYNKEYEEISKDLNEKIKKCEQDIHSNNVIIKNTEKSLNDLKQAKDICPICQSAISHQKHDELTEEYETTIAKCEQVNDYSRGKINEYKELLEDVESKYKLVCQINIPLLKEKNKEFNEKLVEIKEYKKYDEEIEENYSKLEEVEKALSNNKLELERLENPYHTYCSSEKILKDSVSKEELEKVKLELEEKRDRIKFEFEEFRHKISIVDDIDYKIKYLEERQREYNQKLGRVENKDRVINNIKEINEKILVSDNDLKNYRIKLAELSFDDKEYEKINKEYISYDEKIRENMSLITKKETEKVMYKQNLENVENELRNLEKIKKEQIKLKDYIKLLKDLRELYGKDGVQKTLRNRVKPQIERETMNIFSEFDFDYTNINLDDTYAMTIQTGNDTLEITSLSGGEKIVIALALRLAIAKVISQNRTQLLILDEPTVHLDVNKKSDLIDIIRKINIVPQIIVVTHDYEMLNLSDNIINVIKENSVSKIE